MITNPNVKLKDQYGFIAECTPMGELRTADVVRLAGATFEGTVIDSNFWTTGASGTGAAATIGGGIVTLSSGTSATGRVTLQSVRTARYTGGSANRYRSQVSMDAVAAGNIRRWGCFDLMNDGCFFEVNGTTWNVVTRKASVDTPVASTAWNKSTTTPTETNVNTYEIYFTNKSVHFVINDVLVHTVTATTTSWSATKNFKIGAETANSSGTSKGISIWVATIVRLGKLETETQSVYVASNTTTVCKRSAGKLTRITVGGVAAGTVTVYDNVSATGTAIALLTMQANHLPFTADFGIPFHTGLTVVTSAASNITVVYE
jgi:hypothetical protein